MFGLIVSFHIRYIYIYKSYIQIFFKQVKLILVFVSRLDNKQISWMSFMVKFEVLAFISSIFLFQNEAKNIRLMYAYDYFSRLVLIFIKINDESVKILFR